MISQEYYLEAFYPEIASDWSGTPFEDTLTDLTLKKALSLFLDDSESAIKERRNLQYYYLSSVFNTTKPTSTLKKLRYKMSVDNTIFKRVISNLSNVYNDFERIANDDYLKLFENGLFNNTIDNLYNQAIATGEALLRVVITDKIKLFRYDPQNYRYITDEDGNLIEVWIAYLEHKQTKQVIEKVTDISNSYRRVFEVWTNTTARKLDEKLNIIEEYPINGLPFLLLNLNDEASFIDKTSGSFNIMELQLYANYVDFLADENLLSSTVSLWHFINTDVNLNDGIASGSWLASKQTNPEQMPPTIELIQAESKYTDLQEYKERFVNHRLKQLGLPTSIVDSKILSGIAMKIDRIELEEIRKKHEAPIRYFEYKLHELIHKLQNKSVPSFSITFNQTSYDDVIEQQKHELELVKQGILTIEEYKETWFPVK